MATIKIFQFNLFQENTMVVTKDGKSCVIVDPGCNDKAEERKLSGFIEAEGLKPEAILLTHGHPDHIAGAAYAERTFGCPVYMHPEEIPMLAYSCDICGKLGLAEPGIDFERQLINEGDVIEAAGFRFEVIHTPGHTPGGVCYLDRDEKLLFSGDTLFAGTIGRTDLEGSDYDAEITSIMNKLILLDPDTEVFPGHGPATTIGRERTSNPMLEPFNETPEGEDEEPEPVIIRNV